MRKSASPSPGSEALNQARVFGIPLEELQPAGLPGHQVPLLVQHIVDYIEEHGRLDLEGMFLVNGNAERVDWLRQRYDSGKEVDLEKEADLASAVSLLRLFLQELPEPIIPTALQTHILHLYQDYSSEEEQVRSMKYFLQQLPQVNYSLLRFLCRFLSGVASLQEQRWSAGALAAVFGPDIFHLDTEVEGLREQESLSRVLAELLENQEEFFDSEDDDVSTTNDYSSINEQITELLDDEKLEVCEDLPQDGEDAPASDSLKDNPPSSSHISTTISILPGSADIIERTIWAAVEQHFFDLKTSIDHEISSYENQEPGPSEKPVTGSVQKHGEEGPSDAEDPCSPDQETPQIDQLSEGSQGTHKDSESHSAALEEGSGMDLDAEAAEALVDAENNINTARKDRRSCETMDQADIIPCDQSSCECDQNANSDTRPHPPCRRTTSHGHQLHLNCIFPDNQWEDPVPAYKAWQDEGEAGEAQLSPLAGRMVPPPLEEDAHPLLARRFLDFGHSQRFLQQDPDPPTTKTLACGRARRASFGSRESARADSVSHQLSKKLHSLKKKMKQFEEQFEKERNYKPSHADKAANPQVLKWMTDLTKIRKQIKDTKHKVEVELGPLTRPRSNTLPKSFGSTLEHAAPTQEHAAPTQEPPAGGGGGRGQTRPTREETLGQIQSRVQGKREEDGWPEDVKKMTREQLWCEKAVLQKNLLHYEGLHGRPATREERLDARPLYDRYRLVKQMLTRASITPVTVSPSSKRRSQILQPIIEGETAHFCEEIEEVEEEEGEEQQSSGSQIIMSLNPLAPPTSQTEPQGPIRTKMEETTGKLALDLRLSSSNASSMPDLLEQLWKARADKKKLRKTIRQFEDDFYQHNGRAVQKEDRVPMLDEYREYKRIKAKLRLLEVLISKQDSSKSI